MSYWKSKVLPKLKKIFDKGKKKGASEVCKNFDKSKESLDKEIGEKTPDLHPKVVELYRSSGFITKKLLKEPNEPAVKENSDAVQKVLQELAKAGFPGAQVLSEAGSKFGTAMVPGPVMYLFEKTSTFLVDEPLPVEETREIVVEEPKATEEPEKVETSASAPPPAVPEPEAVAEKEKKDETPAEVVIEPKAAGEVSASASEAPPPPPPAVEKVEEVSAVAPAPEKSEPTAVPESAPIKSEP